MKIFSYNASLNYLEWFQYEWVDRLIENIVTKYKNYDILCFQKVVVNYYGPISKFILFPLLKFMSKTPVLTHMREYLYLLVLLEGYIVKSYILHQIDTITNNPRVKAIFKYSAKSDIKCKSQGDLQDSGLVTLSKTRLYKPQYIKFSKSHDHLMRGFTTAIVRDFNKHYLVVNTHLPYYNSYLMPLTLVERQKIVDELITHIRHNYSKFVYNGTVEGRGSNKGEFNKGKSNKSNHRGADNRHHLCEFGIILCCDLNTNYLDMYERVLVKYIMRKLNLKGDVTRKKNLYTCFSQDNVSMVNFIFISKHMKYNDYRTLTNGSGGRHIPILANVQYMK